MSSIAVEKAVVNQSMILKIIYSLGTSLKYRCEATGNYCFWNESCATFTHLMLSYDSFSKYEFSVTCDLCFWPAAS